MTIQELYDFAVANNLQNRPIRVETFVDDEWYCVDRIVDKDMMEAGDESVNIVIEEYENDQRVGRTIT